MALHVATHNCLLQINYNHPRLSGVQIVLLSREDCASDRSISSYPFTTNELQWMQKYADEKWRISDWMSLEVALRDLSLELHQMMIGQFNKRPLGVFN